MVLASTDLVTIMILETEYINIRLCYCVME